MSLKDYSLLDFASLDVADEFWETFSLDRAFDRLTSIKFKEEVPNVAPSKALRGEGAFRPDKRDLCRLYWICRVREVASVLEFGSGFSTAIMALALEDSRQEIGEWVAEHRRIDRPFTLHSLEESSDWAGVTAGRIAHKIRPNVNLEVCPIEIQRFEGRYCSFYKAERVDAADLVYVDGPSQFGEASSTQEWYTDRDQLMPMSADILPLEFFFEPGAVVVFDGRSANARFIGSYFRRNWVSWHSLESDTTILELQEEPLGYVNQSRLSRINENGGLIGSAP